MKQVARLIDAFLHDPVEVAIHVREKLLERGEHKDETGFMPWPPCPYAVDCKWERRLHEAIGASWPCPKRDSFWELWSKLVESLQSLGIQLGRGAFGGWGDGEPGMVRAVWCLTHHLRPQRVIETGVARGITTRFILEALARHERGHLWSIDLPPPRARALHSQIGIAVPDSLRVRWTYVRGSSRRRLPTVVANLGCIDLFVHDSRHTERNLLFELEHAWTALRPGGVVVADDIDENCGFHAFRRAHETQSAFVCHAEPLRPDPGRQDDRGLFAVIVKPTGASADAPHGGGTVAAHGLLPPMR